MSKPPVVALLKTVETSITVLVDLLPSLLDVMVHRLGKAWEVFYVCCPGCVVELNVHGGKVAVPSSIACLTETVCDCPDTSANVLACSL
jgi:hypothetical protein